MFTQTVLANPDRAYPHAHCASLAIGRDGTLFAAWYGYPREEHRDAVIYFTQKPQLRMQWETPKIILPRSSYSYGNPTLFVDSRSRLWLFYVQIKGTFWNTAASYLTWSDDNGKTWAQAQQLHKQEGIMVRHPPIEHQGRLILPAYDEKKKQTILLSADHKNLHWEEIQRFGKDLFQASLIQLGDGSFYLFFRPGNKRHVWLSESRDLRNWSSPTELPLDTALSGIVACSQMNHTALIWNNTTAHQRTPLSISFMSHIGQRWSKPVDIDRSFCELSYPSFLFDRKGDIHGLYTYDRRKIHYVRFNQKWLKEQELNG